MTIEAYLIVWLCAQTINATKCWVVHSEDHVLMADCTTAAEFERTRGQYAQDKRVLVRCVCPETHPSYPLERCDMDEEIPAFYTEPVPSERKGLVQ